MRKNTVNEKSLTSRSIESLALAGYQRSRALANLARAEAIVGAIFAVSKLWKLTPQRASVGTTLKPQ